MDKAFPTQERWAVGSSGTARIEALYRSHSDSAMRLALLLCSGNHAHAEDLVHEAFIRLLGRFGGGRPPEMIEAYLRTTIINLARSEARKDKSRDTYLARRPQEIATLEPAIQQGDETWSALLGLPLRQRAALYFRYFEDLSEDQVADALNCTRSAAKSLIYRALTSLREKKEVRQDD